MTPRDPKAPRALFLVWGPPHKGPRSARFAAALGMPAFFLADRWEQGVGNPLKYPRMLWRTARTLLARRPRVVFVQTPPSFATWAVALYAALSGARFVIDAHSDAFQRDRWTRPAWLNRLVQRRAAAMVVTDGHWAGELRAAGVNGVVIPDIPTPVDAPPDASPAGGRFTVVVVNTWAADEPLAEELAAADAVPEAEFQVTGFADERVGALGLLPANVRFTGFLPVEDYVMALARADAVMCLTTRDHTMQRGACEALSLARPIITSDWPLLRSYFEQGTVHVDNTARGIADGVRRAMAMHEELLAQVADLRQRRFTEWQARREELMQLLEGAGR